ncbi:hypothetical protein GCM10010994_40990 [Chelatococcus reniformis]|uniref:Uncharacterized protein n=1 Tax=Chelatococcus reniformis TaxID=1494448 RepID=A0A916UM39_9HYPH|nr:hypothetical protein GCM10010994_40990 [Chelatococcus reniformis]
MRTVSWFQALQAFACNLQACQFRTGFNRPLAITEHQHQHERKDPGESSVEGSVRQPRSPLRIGNDDQAT